jgi:hypothetical protein
MPSPCAAALRPPPPAAATCAEEEEVEARLSGSCQYPPDIGNYHVLSDDADLHVVDDHGGAVGACRFSPVTHKSPRRGCVASLASGNGSVAPTITADRRPADPVASLAVTEGSNAYRAARASLS